MAMTFDGGYQWSCIEAQMFLKWWLVILPLSFLAQVNFRKYHAHTHIRPHDMHHTYMETIWARWKISTLIRTMNYISYHVSGQELNANYRWVCFPCLLFPMLYMYQLVNYIYVPLFFVICNFGLHRIACERKKNKGGEKKIKNKIKMEEEQQQQRRRRRLFLYWKRRVLIGWSCTGVSIFLHNRRTYSLTLIIILTRVVFSYTLCTLHKISIDLLRSIMSHFTIYSLLLCLALSHFIK